VIWASGVRAKQLSLSVMIDPALARPRLVDSARLLQIVGNLIGNAIKFTSEGGITLRAWPERGRGRPNGIAIEVEDTGSGVPLDAAERIFQPFEQVDVSAKRRHGGLGLGLPIARRLAQAMGGDIELDTPTAMGHGSRCASKRRWRRSVHHGRSIFTPAARRGARSRMTFSASMNSPRNSSTCWLGC